MPQERQLHLLTYATSAEGYFALLSAHPSVTVLGLGTRWGGFHDKVNGVLRYVEEARLPPDALLCFVDGFDSVVLTRDLAEIRRKFADMHADIVFSRERTDPGRTVGYMRRRVFGECDGLPLNSGMWMADVRTARRFWGGMRRGEDDQVYASRVCRSPSSGMRVAIDEHRRLFFNYYPKADDVAHRVRLDPRRYPGRVLVRSDGGETTWSLPCVISAPGSSDMNPLLLEAGFPAHLLPDKSSYPYARQADVFFRQWAFRELLPETVAVLLGFVLLFWLALLVLSHMGIRKR